MIDIDIIRKALTKVVNGENDTKMGKRSTSLFVADKNQDIPKKIITKRSL